MQNQLLKQFGDFFLNIFNDYLSKSIVVKIIGLGYFCILYYSSKSGKNPETGFVLTIPPRKRLFFFDQNDNSSENKLLTSIKLNQITLMETSFPKIDNLVFLLKSKLSNEGFLIQTNDGEKLFNIYRYDFITKGNKESNSIFDIKPTRNLKDRVNTLNNISITPEEVPDLSRPSGIRIVGLRRIEKLKV